MARLTVRLLSEWVLVYLEIHRTAWQFGVSSIGPSMGCQSLGVALVADQRQLYVEVQHCIDEVDVGKGKSIQSATCEWGRKERGVA